MDIYLWLFLERKLREQALYCFWKENKKMWMRMVLVRLSVCLLLFFESYFRIKIKLKKKKRNNNPKTLLNGLTSKKKVHHRLYQDFSNLIQFKQAQLVVNKNKRTSANNSDRLPK